jgi:acetylornithine deacetylase/succinyl-diaminopimelate desuccinylase-like protein
MSVRIPPALDARVCGEAVVRELSRDPPYNAHVTADLIKAGTGFMAPELTPELRSAISEASQSVFGKPYATVHMGGTIPLMNQLKTMFPNAQFFVTGALGPNSNAHCPNETLRIPYLKQFVACLSFVLHKLAAK